VKVRVKVNPNSRTAEVIHEGDKFVVKVKEPPMEGRANDAVVKLLAEHFAVPRSRVRIIGGFSSREKVVEIEE
jgi:hypothetical protein